MNDGDYDIGGVDLIEPLFHFHSSDTGRKGVVCAAV